MAQLVNINTDAKIREMAEFGFKSEVLKYGSCYIVGDPLCPVKTGLAINSEAFLVRFRNGYKFKPSELYNLRGLNGGKKGRKFHVESQFMFCCVAPNLCGKYTNLN